MTATLFSELASLEEGEWQVKTKPGWLGRRKNEGWMHVQRKALSHGKEEVQLTWTSHRDRHRVSFLNTDSKQAYVINLDPAGDLLSFAETMLSAHLVYAKDGCGSYASADGRQRGMKVLQRFHDALVVEKRGYWHPPKNIKCSQQVPARKMPRKY